MGFLLLIKDSHILCDEAAERDVGEGADLDVCAVFGNFCFESSAPVFGEACFICPIQAVGGEGDKCDRDQPEGGSDVAEDAEAEHGELAVDDTCGAEGKEGRSAGSGPADDEVVDEAQFHDGGCLDESGGDGVIGAAGRRIAGGVIVKEDEGVGVP